MSKTREYNKGVVASRNGRVRIDPSKFFTQDSVKKLLKKLQNSEVYKNASGSKRSG